MVSVPLDGGSHEPLPNVRNVGSLPSRYVDCSSMGDLMIELILQIVAAWHYTFVALCMYVVVRKVVRKEEWT